MAAATYPLFHLNAFIGCSEASSFEHSAYPAEAEIPSSPLYLQEKVDAVFKREIQALLPFNPSMRKEEMRERYMLLQDEKWRECIDGRDAPMASIPMTWDFIEEKPAM